jgi:type I restriction enzyme M protein
MKKNKKENKTLFIDASKEFIKVTNSNKLTDGNIQKILDAFVGSMSSSTQNDDSMSLGTAILQNDGSMSMGTSTLRNDIPYFCKYVHNDEVMAQNYNPSVSTYVEKEDTREVIDIKVLNEQIKGIVERQSRLREELDEIIREIEGD